MKNKVLIPFLLLIGNLSLFASDAKLSKGKWIDINIQPSLVEHLEELNDNEKEEQKRDWVVVSFFNYLELDEKTFFDAFYDYSPLRQSFKHDLIRFKYGESRSVAFDNGDLYVFVPKKSPKQKLLIARESDAYRLLKGVFPQKIMLVEYELLDTETIVARFAYTMDISANQVFSNEYGYVEQTVRNKTDLQSFVQSIDDITYAKKEGRSSVILGGRKFDKFRTRTVNLKDIAVLYQADENIEVELLKRLDKRGLYEEYEGQIRETVDLNQAQDSYWANQPRFLLESLCREKYPYSNFKERLIEQIKSDGINIGFSLDPKLQKQKFTSGLRRIVAGDRAFFEEWFDKYVKQQTINTFLLGRESGEEDKDRLLDYLLDTNNEFNNYNSKERSVFSLIGIAQENEGKDNISQIDDVNTQLKESFDVSDEEIEKYVNERRNNMYQALQNQQGILLAICSKVDEGDMLPYYNYKSYLDNELPFEINTTRTYSDVKLKTEESGLELYLELMMKGIDEEKIIDLLQNKGPKALYDFVESKGINAEKYFEVSQYQQDNILDKYIFADAIYLMKNMGYEMPKSQLYSIESYYPILADTLERIQDREGKSMTGILDQNSYRLLTNNFFNTDFKIAQATINSFLFDWYQSNSYQHARYDGDLQGTEVGMTLFYTDLIMKLWSMDYGHSIPSKQVPGFLASVTNPIDFTYYEQVQLLTSTRSWLGALPEGYDATRNTILFQHSATRIFNASSSDLFPGIEVPANIKSKLFAQWWNDNYSKVADYEPEFHRLNQIMKWSGIIQWLKSTNQFRFLSSVSVNRDLDFEKWYRREENNLKVNLELPFKNKSNINESVECLDMINSRPYFPFNRELMVFRVSGGVSTMPKEKIIAKINTPRRINIRKSGVARKGIDFSITDKTGEITFIDKRKINIKPRNFQADITAEVSSLQSTSAELTKVKYTHKIQNTLGKTVFDESNNDVSIAKVQLQKNGETVEMKYDIGDWTKAEKGLQKLVESPNEIDYIKEFYQLEGRGYLAKLKDSDTWVEVQQFTSREVPDNIDLKVAKNQDYFTDEVNYVTGEFTDNTTFTKVVQEYEWYTSTTTWSGDSRTIFTYKNPSIAARDMSISKGDYVRTVKVSDNAISIPNNPNTISKDIDLVNTVKGNDITTITKNLPRDKTAVKLTYNDKAEIIGISEGKIVTDDITYFKSIISETSAIKAAIIKDSKGVKLVDGQTIKVPRNSTKEDLEVIRFLTKKIDLDSKWITLFKQADIIDVKDIRMLSKITDDNIDLSKNYYSMKQVNNLPDDCIVGDISTKKGNPQVLILQKEGQPEVLNLDMNLSEDVEIIGRKLKAHDNKDAGLTKNQIDEFTEIIASIYDKIATLTGRKNVIATPIKGIRPTLFYRMKRPNSDVRVYKDQSDIQKSIDNAMTTVYADLDSSIFLTTVALESFPYENVESTMKDIYDIGMDFDTTMTTSLFRGILQSDYKQIYMIVRANEEGIVFRDRTATYEEVKQWVSISTSKDFLYIISNEGDELQKLFSDSGKFTKVVGSNFSLGNPEQFGKALRNMRDVMKGLFDHTIVLTKGQYKKLSKKFPNFKNALLTNTKLVEKKYQIAVGKANKRIKETLPKNLTAFLNKTGNDINLKTLTNAVDDVQDKWITSFEGKDYGGNPINGASMPHNGKKPSSPRSNIKPLRPNIGHIPDIKCELEPLKRKQF